MNKKCYGVFNIASGKAVNLQKIFNIINKINKKNFIKKFPKKNILANINKIKKIGWNPKYTIFNILKNFEKKI
jgi:hypothetical protein